jgi:hypothetical protein
MLRKQFLPFLTLSYITFLIKFEKYDDKNKLVLHVVKHIINRSDIFRPQTRRVSQTIVFRYREIDGRLCTGTKYR